VRFILKERVMSDKIVYALLVVLYRLLLDVAYTRFVFPQFSYMGFVCQKTTISIILSWILLLVYMVLNYRFFFEGWRLSSEILFMLFLLSMVPSTTATAYGLINLSVTACNTAFWLSCFFFLGLFSHLRDPIAFSLSDGYADLNEKIILAAAVVFGAAIFYISWRYTSLRLHFDLQTVYELRDEAKGFSVGRAASYLYSWGQVCLPIIMAYYFVRRKWLLGATCFMLLLLAFGIDGSKFIFFLAVISAIISNLPIRDFSRLNRWLLLGVIGIVSGGLVLFYAFGNIPVLSYFVRRTMFLPLRLEQCYYEFFTVHTPDYFRGSFLRHFGFSTSYPNMAKMIGELYFNSSDTNANSGLVANAVANLGVPGCVIMPFLMGFVLHLMDLSSEGIDTRIYISTAVYSAQSLINSAFFTVLLTHGMLIVIILLAMMKKRETHTLHKRIGPESGRAQ
jgi:hypothetical protein